jgi:NADH-quinone oxidoreductase subunit K
MDQMHLLFLGAFLFAVGIVIVITKKNLIMVLMGIELMLNAANLNLIVFGRQSSTPLDGQLFAIFVIVVAVCEAAVGLAIIIRVYTNFHTSIPDDLTELKE